jgi:hypothetical protein
VAAVAERVKVEALIRECDLLQALGRVVEAEPCWALATQRFPSLAGTPFLRSIPYPRSFCFAF